MSIEIIDFKTPCKVFELEIRGFVVLTLTGTTLIELAVYAKYAYSSPCLKAVFVTLQWIQ